MVRHGQPFPHYRWGDDEDAPLCLLGASEYFSSISTIGFSETVVIYPVRTTENEAKTITSHSTEIRGTPINSSKACEDVGVVHGSPFPASEQC